MPYIVRSKDDVGKSIYLKNGVDTWEFYWVSDPNLASQFSTKSEAESCIPEWMEGVEIIEYPNLQHSDIQKAVVPLTLGDLAEGKKFELVPNSVITFMKIVQPTDTPSDSKRGSDACYHLPGSLNYSWVVVLTNEMSEDEGPESRIGKIILLKNNLMVWEVQ